MDTLEQLKAKLIKAQSLPEKGLAIKLTIHNLQILIKDLEQKNKM